MLSRLTRVSNREAQGWAVSLTAFLVLFVLFSLEWLFLVTKPSFADIMSWPEKLQMLVLTAIVVPAVVAGLIGLVLHAIGFPLLSNRYTAWIQELLAGAVTLIVSVFLAMLALLMIDNFSYTLFGYGIRMSQGGERSIYGLALGVLLLLSFLYLTKLGRRVLAAQWLPAVSHVLAFAGLFGLVGLGVLAAAEDDSEKQSRSDLPNILILSSDGIRASRMSVYGAERNTTPYLLENSGEWLRFDAAYSNGADSGASVISMLTGKYPATTRLIYPPDVLRGRHSFEHLPGYLRRLGYYSADVSVRHYTDPFDLNMRFGFDEAYGGSVAEEEAPPALLQPLSRWFSDEAYFAGSVIGRLKERYQHIFDIEDMDAAVEEVVDAAAGRIGDQQRLQDVESFLSRTKEPFFLNVHLLAPHGDRFVPQQRIFSKGKKQVSTWDLDFYDDTLLDFDSFVASVIQQLEDQGRLDRSVIIVTSDHGILHETTKPVPLLFRYPNAEKTGNHPARVERLDIAPTILNILGEKVPDWMEGRVLSADVPGLENIFSTIHVLAEQKASGWFAAKRSDPPFYSLGRLRLVRCNQAFTWRLIEDEMKVQPVVGDDCDSGEPLQPQGAKLLMRAHLEERGYEF